MSPEVLTTENIIINGYEIGPGADLSGLDLSGLDLSGVDLEGSNLMSADLSGADLEGANLVLANLEGANLEGANLAYANLESANPIYANLDGANLYEAINIPSWIDTSGAIFISPESALRINGYEIGPGADLSGLDLSGLDLSGVDLEGSNLMSADLSGADLEGANLVLANLEGANLEGANLAYANLESANPIYANLDGANLYEAINIPSWIDTSGAIFISPELEEPTEPTEPTEPISEPVVLPEPKPELIPELVVLPEPEPELIPELVVLPEPKISEIGAQFGYQLRDENGNLINHLAVLGSESDKEYTLEITGKSLVDGFNLDSVDLTIDFDTDIFNSINIESDVVIESLLPISNAVSYEEGTVRFTAASLSELSTFADQSEIANPYYYGDSVYTIISTATGDVAHAKAQELGGYLATVNDAAENKFLYQTFGDNVWIGFNDAAREGSFVWADGSTSNYTNWNGNEPNNSGGEDYVHFTSGGRWNDHRTTFPGIVEIPLSSYQMSLGDGISNETDVIASIKLDFNEEGLSQLAKNEDGSFVENPFGFEITANLNDTVLSREIDDGSGFTNKEIYSLNQFGGEKFSVEGTDVFLYEQKAGLLETGDGLIISTDRVIGADAAETNLVRAGDTLIASTSWINTGNIDLEITDVRGLISDANAVLASYGLSQETLLGGTYGEEGFISSAEELTLTADITITGDAGSIVDLSKSILEVSASGIDESFSNSKGTKNLITYQGDLNYDGRVSMKDLAYLNAGAARVNSGGDVAGDVDANYDDSIDLLDLAVLDKDWGKSLHDGRDEFLGSNELSWEELDNQGSKNWDNAVFKEQNAFEAFDGFVGSLESPTSNVIGADGNTDANDGDMLYNGFQENI